jgi:anti-sigma factor ChrR (cupin superfamily)
MHNRNDENFQARAALYALGAMSLVEARAFEEELDLASEAARAETAEFQAIASQLGLTAAEATPSPDLRRQLLARIASEPQPAKTGSLSPPALPTHLDVLAQEGDWKPLFAGGAGKTLFTEPSNGYVTSLLRLDPGTRIPDHQHRGNEQCLIVVGEFSMNDKLYKPGDFTVALAGSEHVGLYTETGGILLLVSPPDYELLRH